MSKLRLQFRTVWLQSPCPFPAHCQDVLPTSDPPSEVRGHKWNVLSTAASLEPAQHTGHNAAHTLRPQASFPMASKPGYLVCKTKPPFLQQKVNTIHNYPVKLLTPPDTAPC